MELITPTVQEETSQERCIECDSLLVNLEDRELVCETCGIVAETSLFDFREPRSSYKWRQRALEHRSRNGCNSIQYRILNVKLKRSNKLPDREKLFSKEISRICAALELSVLVLDNARLHHKEIIARIPQYTHLEDVLATATALVWGCTFIYTPRTIREIMSVASSVVDKNRVLQAANRIVFPYLLEKLPDMKEKKQLPSLVNHYLNHFGAILGVSPNEILKAKEIAQQLEYKRYTMKPDILSIALLWYICMRRPTKRESNTSDIGSLIQQAMSLSKYEKSHRLRRLIITHLSQHQGLTTRQLATLLRQSYRVAYYHLQRLTQANILCRVKQRMGRRTYNVYRIMSTEVSMKNKKHQNTRLNWNDIAQKCFVAKRTPMKIVREIQKDMESIRVEKHDLLSLLTSDVKCEAVFSV